MWFASTTFGMAVDKTVEYNSERNVGGHLWALPEPPTDKSIQQDLGKEALWRASQQDPFLTHTEADDEDREYLFRYIEGLPQFASLKNQNYSQVMNNREKHRKLESLYGDSREVEAMFQDVEKLLTKIKSRTKTPNEIFDKYHDAFKKTEKFKEELSIYKQVKFWQIINSHSKDTKSNNTRKKPGEKNDHKISIVEQFRKRLAILKNRSEKFNFDSCQPATIQRQPDHSINKYLETLLHILPP
ncbi:hypothetical protein PGT21_031483 [Puccinia graminis f. sp. tritici]|uniref:Uncharacterized protein n=1 Tax=Puccinia graminis f. sp. tritici TaxID=56615 RepID=A0A5B0MEY2_PUCGR|nr:hypothetical protein PGT21_031483 [Puccinia graminis f. sp. tritici]